ncbi:nitroreductase [Candidatus Chlorohelix sp.]|uniref:nitroreductase family protein n=1 Tax=Candidatus Chlorohelix sp. TaxID=3139201 RepID=UPI00302B78DE
MNVLETIKVRRSVGKVTEKKPTREQIEILLDAACQAPNHHMVEPWRYFVIAGVARAELSKIMVESLTTKLENTTDDKAQALLEKEGNKLFRAPVVIIAASLKPSSPKVVDIENVEAVAAAVQNMLLAAQEIGLVAIWRTGEPAYDPAIKAFLGLEPEEHIVAFVYLGYPAMPNTERTPNQFENKTQWLGWED